MKSMATEGWEWENVVRALQDIARDGDAPRLLDAASRGGDPYRLRDVLYEHLIQDAARKQKAEAQASLLRQLEDERIQLMTRIGDLERGEHEARERLKAAEKLAEHAQWECLAAERDAAATIVSLKGRIADLEDALWRAGGGRGQ